MTRFSTGNLILRLGILADEIGERKREREKRKRKSANTSPLEEDRLSPEEKETDVREIRYQI